MSETRYTKDHEWVRVDGAIATIGISNHAQEQLGDVVFVELPEVGRQVEQQGRDGGGRERQGGERRLRAGERRGGRGQRRAQRRSRAGQQRRREQRLVLQAQAGRSGRARAADRRRRPIRRWSRARPEPATTEGSGMSESRCPVADRARAAGTNSSRRHIGPDAARDRGDARGGRRGLARGPDRAARRRGRSAPSARSTCRRR